MAYTDQILKQSLGQLSTLGSGTLTGQGGADIGRAGDYFRTLLGGSRQAIMQQAAPGLNLALDQASAERRAAARGGTARTGGAASEQAQQQDALQKAFDTLVGQQQAGAADKLTSIGESELKTMMDALNIGGNLAESDINSRRQASAQMWGSLIGGAAGIATGGMLGGFGKLFGGGTKTPTSTGGGVNQPIPFPEYTPPPVPYQTPGYPPFFDPNAGLK